MQQLNHEVLSLHYSEPPPVGAHVWFLDGWNHIREGIVSCIDGQLAFIDGNDEDPLYNRFTVTRLPQEIYQSHLDCLREQLSIEMRRHQNIMAALLVDTKGTDYAPFDQGMALGPYEPGTEEES